MRKTSIISSMNTKPRPSVLLLAAVVGISGLVPLSALAAGQFGGGGQPGCGGYGGKGCPPPPPPPQPCAQIHKQISVNKGQTFTDTATATAPADAVYRFTVTNCGGNYAPSITGTITDETLNVSVQVNTPLKPGESYTYKTENYQSRCPSPGTFPNTAYFKADQINHYRLEVGSMRRRLEAG
jgi:hypothetical protein